MRFLPIAYAGFAVMAFCSHSFAQTSPSAPPPPVTVEQMRNRLFDDSVQMHAARQQAQEQCLIELKSNRIEAESMPQPQADHSYCVIDAPVRLASIIDAHEQKIDFPDKPLLACTFAKEFAQFSSRVLSPLAASTLGAPLMQIGTGPGFECRARNRAVKGKMSAHGRGLAVDVQFFKTKNGGEVTFGKAKTEQDKIFMVLFPRAACGFFATVLGPSSGDMHKDHIHIDMEPRKQKYGSFCQP